MARFDLAVVGGGPAGYAAALRGRELGATVALIEAQHVGGHCVHFSCVPSTVMLDSARRVMETQEMALAGVLGDPGPPSLQRAVARKSVLTNLLAQRITALLGARRVTLLDGRARFHGPTSLAVQLNDGGEETIDAGGIVVATGARYEPAPLAGIPANDQLTPDQALALPAVPGTALVLGGGPSGLGFAWEYASLFGVFGGSVILLEPESLPLPGIDADVTAVLREAMTSLGVETHLGATLTEATRSAEGWSVQFTTAEGPRSASVEAVLRPDARVPASDVPGLEDLGVLGDGGWIPVDDRCATSARGLFAAGDLTGPPLLSNVAERQGRVAAENALGGAARVDLSLVPLVLHTEPEVAGVGMTEAQARAEGYAVTVGLANLSANARAAALGRREGLVKLIADGETSELLGVHLAAPFASEAIAQGVLALQLGARLEDLAAVSHWHPSIAEALGAAARAALG